MDRPELNIEKVVANLEQDSDQFSKERLAAKTAEIKKELETKRALDFIDAICVLRHAENQGLDIKGKMHEVNLMIVDDLSNEAERYIKSIVTVLNEYKLLAHLFKFSDEDLPDPFKIVLDRKVELPTPEQLDFLDRNLFKPYLISGNLRRQTLVDHFPETVEVKLDLHEEAPEVKADSREFYFMALKEDWGDQVIKGKPDEIDMELEALENALQEKDPKLTVTGLNLNENLFFHLQYLAQNQVLIDKDKQLMDLYHAENLVFAENFQVSNGLIYNTGYRVEPASPPLFPCPVIKIWQARQLYTERKYFNARFAVRIDAKDQNG